MDQSNKNLLWSHKNQIQEASSSQKSSQKTIQHKPMNNLVRNSVEYEIPNKDSYDSAFNEKFSPISSHQHFENVKIQPNIDYFQQQTYSTQVSKIEEQQQQELLEKKIKISTEIQKKQVKKRKKSRSKSKSNNKQKELLKSFHKEENEVIIFECELLKLCPGVERKIMKANRDLNGGNQYVSRWCQLTENKFRYYKNQIWALKQPEKPLFSIPLIDIHGFEKQKLNKDESYFEIILVKTFQQFLKEKAAENLSKIFESSAEKEERSTQSKKHKNSSISPEREVKSGHLMRMPQAKQKQNQQKNQNDFKFMSINESFTKATHNSRNMTSQMYYNTYDKNQWTKREETWYDIEEKLIFKNNHLNPQNCEKSIINKWITAIMKQKNLIEQGEEDRPEQQFYTFAQPLTQKSLLADDEIQLNIIQ